MKHTIKPQVSKYTDKLQEEKKYELGRLTIR